MQLSVPQSCNSSWRNTKKLVVLLFAWYLPCVLPLYVASTHASLCWGFPRIRQIKGKMLGLYSTYISIRRIDFGESKEVWTIFTQCSVPNSIKLYKLISYEIPRNCTGFLLSEIRERSVKRFISHLTIFCAQQGTVSVDAANECVPKCRSTFTQWRGTLSQKNHGLSH
jgi:hypothetical protein